MKLKKRNDDEKNNRKVGQQINSLSMAYAWLSDEIYFCKI
jgi:hypothetical protein